MAKGSEEPLKSFANQLAEAALSEGGARALSWFHAGGLFGTRPDGAAAKTQAAASGAGSSAMPTPQTMNSDRIGIWERRKGSPNFLRRLDMVKEWNFWANLGKIEPKGARKRVVFIGESVARGYLYDPQFTPAMVLERILQSEFGEGAVEIIDLARTDLGFDLKDLAISAGLLLEPDAVVIFAGNNWMGSSGIHTSFTREDFPFLAGAVTQRGVAGIKRLAEDRIAEQARLLIHEIASIYQARNVPLLWIVPEFNLADWRDPINNAPYLHDDANREWLDLHDQAEAALHTGDMSSALDCAKRMLELDGGVTISAFRLMADCARKQGDPDAARGYLESARDAIIWDRSFGYVTPRTYSIVQRVLREEPLKFRQNHVLDLPRHFRGHLKSALPDRRLFLDYCHMTSEGIRVAMAAAAACVVKALKGTGPDWQLLVRHSPSPIQKVEAEAAFLVAVHNAHWFQSCELVSYYCSRAVKFAPEIAQVMIKFADLQSRRYPMYMYKATEEIAGMSWPSIQHYVFHMPASQFDETLVNAILEATQAAGMSGSEEIARLRREEHAVTSGPANLLDRYYLSAAVQPQEASWTLPAVSAHKQNHYYKAYSKQSKFFYVGETDRRVLLSLTCRLSGAGEGTIKIETNRRYRIEIPVTSQWSTWAITVPEDAAVRGLNEVVIHWPAPVFSASEGLNAALDNIRNKLEPEFYCVFGEVHTFTAADAQECLPRLSGPDSENSTDC